MSRNDSLVWVGSSYRTVHRFVAEAKRQGCSRKLPSWPAWLVPGESRVFLAHRGRLQSVDSGVIFGYFVAAGVDLVMPRPLLIDHRRAWKEAEAGERGALARFWSGLLPAGLPSERLAASSAPGTRAGERLDSGHRGDDPRTSEDPPPPRRDRRDDFRDDLIDVFIDLLFDCTGEAPLPEGGLLVGTFQTSLEDERECGFRLRESGGRQTPSTGPGVYVVDPVARAVDEFFCELLKELVAETLKDDRRVKSAASRPPDDPPAEDHPVWEAVDELRTGLERTAAARPRRRRLRRGIDRFDQAVERARSRFAGMEDADLPAEIPASIEGLARRETPGLVVFKTPYPRFRRLCDASFRGAIRVDGDELLAGIAANASKRSPIAIPYLVADPVAAKGAAGRKLADLVALLASRCQSRKRLAKTFLRSFVAMVEYELAAGRRVSIPGLGSFEVRARAARKGTHPQTGEPITIPARNVVRFRPARRLRDRVRREDG